MELLDKRPDAPYVHGAVRLIDTHGKTLPPGDFPCAPVEERSVTLPRFLTVNFVNITSMLFRVTSLRRHNLGFESRYPLLPDWALQMKLAMLDGPLVYDSKPTACYRIHPQSIARMASNSFEWAYEAARLRVDALVEYPEIWKQTGINPEVEARALTSPLWRLAVQQIRRGNFANAKVAWCFYREFHSFKDALSDFPRYFGAGRRKIIKPKRLVDS
jgi:hypothetical protein